MNRNPHWARAAKDDIRRERIAVFAEVISDNGSVAETCQILGIARSTGKLYLNQMRADLGAQAI